MTSKFEDNMAAAGFGGLAGSAAEKVAEKLGASEDTSEGIGVAVATVVGIFSSVLFSDQRKKR